MTPKQKSKQLVDSFFRLTSVKDNIVDVIKDSAIAKKSALICVNEIIQSQEDYGGNNIYSWKKVKKEIIKL